MKMRKWKKTLVAMTALTAMLLENTFSVMAAVNSESLLSGTDDVIAEEAVQTEGSLAADDVSTDGLLTDESGADELVSDTPTRDIDISIGEETGDDVLTDEGSVTAGDDGVRAVGVDELTLYLNTDQMNSSDTFGIDISGAASPVYSSVLDDTLAKGDSNIYNISGLDKKKVTIKAVSLSSGMSAQYSVRADGNPQITLISADAPKADRKLRITDSGFEVKGSGYDELEFSLDGTSLASGIYYNLYVKTKAQVKCNDDVIKDGVVRSIYRSTSSIRLSNLDNKAFTIYIEGDNSDKVAASYSIDSVENGAVSAVVTLSDEPVKVIHEDEEDEDDGDAEEEEAVKRVYTYEDADVSVTATLQYADAVPDDAEFIVTPVTASTPGYNFDAYMEALNNNADKILGADSEGNVPVITEDRALLYDVGFFITDEEGKKIELQPEEGSVQINIDFKKNQLKDELGADADQEVTIVHLPLKDAAKEEADTTEEATDISASDINVEVVNAEATPDSVDFTLSDFSIITVLTNGKMVPGATQSFKDVLGDGVGYGIVANEMTLKGDIESTIAVGTLNGGAAIKSSRNNGGAAGSAMIGYYSGNYLIYDVNGENNTDSDLILYTAPENYGANGKFGADMWNNGHGRTHVTVDTSFSAEQIKKTVAELVSDAKKKSTYLYEQDSYAASKVIGKKSNVQSGESFYELDLASNGSGAGTYYVSFEKGEFKKYFGDGLTYITLADGQNVVFNIPDTEVSFCQFYAKIGKYDGGTHASNAEDDVCQNVIFNAPYATKAYTAGEGGASADGIFLVPNAEFRNGVVSGGWVVADKIPDMGTVEWHNVWHNMPPGGGCKAVILAYKKVNCNVPTADQKFWFDLYAYGDQPDGTKSGTLIDSVQNDGSLISFKPITYTKKYAKQGEDIYKYKVVERAADADGFTHDTTQYIVAHNVTENVNGKLSVAVRYIATKVDGQKESSSIGTTYDKIVFRNCEKQTIPYSFDVKKLFDKSGAEWPDGATFTFRMEKFDGGQANSGSNIKIGPLPADTKVNDNYCELTLTKDMQEGSFGKVEFELYPYADSTITQHYFTGGNNIEVWCRAYMYKIYEVIPTNKINGVTYDTSIKYLKIFVNTKYDRIKNKYYVEIEDRISLTNTANSCEPNEGKPFEFTNKYEPGSLKIKKVAVDANGNKVDSDKDFYVVVYSLNDKGNRIFYGTDGSEGFQVEPVLVKGNSEVTYKPLPVGRKYYVYESDVNGIEMTAANSVYEVSYSSSNVELKDNCRDKTVTVTNKRQNGKLKLIKYDEARKNKLAGAVFELYKDGKRYPDNNTVYEVGSNGEKLVENLPWGTYYFVEIKAPEGYKLPEGDAAKTESKVIDSTTVKTVQIIEMTDEKIRGDVVVYKVDDKDKALAGAQFALYASKGSNDTAERITTSGSAGAYSYDAEGTVQTLDTDADGRLQITGLPYGKYSIVETKAPANHIIDATPRVFTVDGTKAVVEFTFVNTEIRANVEFIKVDNANAPLEGIVFKLFKKVDGQYSQIDTVTSGVNGHVLVEGLGEGTYYFIEDPDSVQDYTPDTRQHFFAITADDNGKTLTLPSTDIYKYTKVDGLSAVINTPLKGKAELFKFVKRGEDKIGLEGAEFELYKEEAGKDPVKIGDTYTSGSDGFVRVNDLEWGSYYFVEKKAPTGFVEIKDPIRFEIAKGMDFSKAVYRELENPPIKGYVELLKLDADDKDILLDGVTFELYSGTPDAPGSLIDTYTTGVSTPGMITKEDVGALEYGNYYFVEKETVKGYVIDTTPHAFSITENGAVVTIKATNPRQPGRAVLEKWNSTRTKNLKGAKFDLFKVPDGFVETLGSLVNLNRIGNYETNELGIITVEGLEWGSYYFIETEAPKGYEKTDTKYDFVINADNLEASLTADKGATNPEKKGSINLIKKDGKNNKLKGALFALYKDGKRYPDDSKIYETDKNGEIFVGNLSWGTYYFEELQAPEGYETPVGDKAKTPSVTIDENNVEDTVVITMINDEIFGDLDVIKVDGEGNELTGAQFSLYRRIDGDDKAVLLEGANGSYSYVSERFISTGKQLLDTNGAKLSVTGLPYGTYRLYEETAPAGFEIPDRSADKFFYEFTIDEQGEHIEYRFENYPVYAGVKFIKADADGNKLEGAVFALYKYTDATHTDVEPLGEVSDDNGVIRKTGLSVGDYFFIETKAPKGRIKTDKKYEFTITEKDIDTEVTLKNADGYSADDIGYVINPPQPGKVRLKKAEAGTENGLKGALFDLYRKGVSTAIMKDLESDSEGYVRVDNLEWDKYYFKETKAVEGYALDDKEYWFEVNEDNASEEQEITVDLKGKDLVVYNTPIYGGAYLEKQDSVTKKPIEGAVFALFYDDGTDKNMVPGYESMQTGPDGKISTNKDLKAGKYYFKEITAPKGYTITDTHYEFTIDQSVMDKIIPAGKNGIALNPPIPGEVWLFKYTDDEKQIPLSEAIFTLKKEKFGFGELNDEIIGTYSTGADGMIKVTGLEWGTYYFVEEQAPKGYKIDKDVDLKFTIDADHLSYTEGLTKKCENPPYPGKVKLIKYRSVNGEVTGTLEGAKFKFFKRQGADSIELKNPDTADGQYVSGKDGSIVIGDLEWGKYYFEETEAPEGFALPENTITDDLEINAENAEASAQTPVTVEVTNPEIYGNVELRKIDDKTPANGLEGAVFKLYTKAGDTVYVNATDEAGVYDYAKEGGIEELVTPKGGYIYVRQLPYGDYYFQETESPEDFVLIDTPINFSIDKNQAPDDKAQVKLAFINPPVVAGVEFIKVDDIGHPLDDCKFTLYKETTGSGDDLTIADVYSDENGKVYFFGLGTGTYYFVETATKDNAYTPYSGRLYFEISKDDNKKTVGLRDITGNTVENPPKLGRVKLIKYSVVNGNRVGTIAGAEFDLYMADENGDYTKVNKDGEPYVIPAAGEITITGLKWGSYYFIETKAPEGHTCDLTKKYEFEITSGDVDPCPIKEIEVDNPREPGRVEIEKIDKYTRDHVSGATFHLYKDYQTADEQDLGTRITEAGTASWEGLLWGSYTLVEDKPAAGYVAVKTLHNFTIDADCLEMLYTGSKAIENPPIQGWFKLEKRDKATNQVIPKVEFKLFKVNESGTGEYLKDYKLITNEKGILEDQNGNTQIGPLRSGAYYLEEVTPEGYEPLDKQISFKIEYDNQLEEFTVDRAVRNTPILGSVLLYKVDEDKNPLKGATFKLYATKPRNIGDSFATLINKDHVYEYGEYVTNDNGAIKVTDLPWDDYFFVETQAPKGYEILEKDKTYDFTVNAQNANETIPIGPIGNRKLTGTVGLKKIDSDNNKALQGAEFKLYMRTADGGTVDVSPDYGAINGVFVTDANGEINVEDVKWGTYFFDETKAPEGYEPISDTNRVTSRDLIINEKNYDDKAKIMQPQTDTVRNVKGYGHVKLIKKFTQEISGSLAGIRFDLHSDKWSDIKPLYTDENGNIEAAVIGDLEYGHYWFTEESVPVELNCPVSDFELHFTIDRSNPESDPIEYEFVNSPVYASAKFIKVDPYVYVEGQQGSEGTIDGIRFSVFTADGKPVTEVTSKNGGVVEVNHLPMGEYYFLENADSAAEAGYVASTDKYEFTIGPDDGVAPGQPEKYVDVYKEGNKVSAVSTVPNPPFKGSIRLIKLGTSMDGSSKEIDISDAEFELYKDGEGLIMTSDELAPLNNGKEIVVTGLEWGKYYFKETKAPKGYALPEGNKVYSTVAEIGANNVFESVGAPITCQINDETIRVFISKRKLFGTEELPGAKMSLYAADDQDNRTGSPILEWVSTSVPKVIEVGGDLKEGVVAGRHYVIHEEAAPAGYAFAKDIPFSVNEDGSINANTYSTRLEGSGNGMTIIVDDPPLCVHISKRELGTNVELSGAKLQIKDKDDNVIEAWTCTGDDHEVKAVLSVGETYILEETDPPKGYYTAEPITFTITENGFIDILKDASASATLEAKSPSLAGTSLSVIVSTLVMYDRPVRVEISKKRLSGSDTDYVQGAELALYEKDGEDYKQIAAWVSSGDKPYVVEYGLLKVGGSYKVVETSVPKGYVKAKDLYFTVKDTNEFVKTNGDGLFVQKEVMYDPSVNVKISKKSSTGEDELPGATLKVVDSQGNDVVSFVSGRKQTLLTSIKSADALSADEKAAFADYNVIYDVKLETGKSYKLKEVSAPAGYALAEDVEFKIDENGNQVPAPVVMRDKPLEISLSKKDIADGSYLEGATLEFKNAAGEVVAEWVSSDKPILITLRDVSEAEAAGYAQVIKKALPAGDYVLHEVKAPVGYKTAPDMKITITGADVKKADGSIREESMYDYREGKVTIFGTKEWIVPKDSSGNVSSDFTYPDLTIELYRDSETQGELDANPIQSIVLKNGTANYAFGDLERYRTDGGKNYEYTYKVIEKLPKEAEGDYKCIELEMKKTEDGLEANYTVGFINTLSQRYVTLPVTKTFVLFKDKDGKVLNDVKYDTVTIWLMQNGKRVDIDGDGKEESVTIENGAKDQGGKVTFKFVDLPEFDLTTGNAYEYTVEETGAEGYDSKVVYKDGAAEIFNTPKQAPFYIKGVKTWIDPDGTKRPDVTMQLFRDGKLYKETKLSADNTFSFGPLYEYNFGWGNEEGDMKDTADGHRFLYEIKEIGAVGYEVTVIGSGTEMVIKDAVAEVKVTNKLKQEYVEKSGNKYWNDNGDSANRPPVTINLYATDSTGRKDEFVDSYVIPNTSTRYEFGTKGRKQLPKYDANGKEISYRVEETEIPGYASVKQGDDFINTPTKTVISKIDAATNAELPGAVLALTKKGSKKEVERWTSTSKPHYIEGLEIGVEYTLTEISAPKGYVIASPVTFKVAADGVEQKVVMVDDPVIGEVVLTKLDAATREKLSGAQFNLYTSDGKAIKAVGSTGSYNYTESSSGSADLTVGSDGTLKVGELPYGAYYFKEVKAPDGYELSSDTVSFTIAEKNAKATVTFLNESRKGSATLLKTNADGSSALAGAVFELYSKTPSSTGQAAASTVFSDAYYRYGTYTTDSNGRIEVTGLPWDDYYFIEVQAPEGYQINRDVTGDPLVYTFSVTADNAGGSAIRVATVANEEITEEGGVLGARVPEKASGVLGVRSAPKKGVLGTRVGPATGDVSAIALWLALLLACVGTIIWLVTDAKRKRSTDK